MRFSLTIMVLSMALVLSLVSCADKPKESVAITEKAVKKEAPKEENDFQAKYLDGKPFDSKSYTKDKLVLGFFSHKHKDAASMLKALMLLKPFEGEYRFKVVLVCIDHNQADGVEDYLKKEGIDLPVLLEGPGLELAEKYKIEHEVALVGLDNDHKPFFGLKRYTFSQTPDGEEVFVGHLKEALGIKVFDPNKPNLGVFPLAKDFTAKDLDGKTFNLKANRGKVVHLVFFSPSCPHCKHELIFLRDKIYPEYHDKGLEIIALSSVSLKDDMLKKYQALKTKWPIIEDKGRKIRKLFSKERAVPDNVIIDKQGRIRESHTGYSKKMNDIYIMRIRHLLGLKNPPILSDKKYNGAAACQICHEKEYTSWSVSKHARAWQTLEIDGAADNPDCVGCHTLGFNDPKGFKPIQRGDKEIIRVYPAFQNVSCENCHGIGGPHIAKKENLMDKAILQKQCLTCHTKKWSPDFDFEKALKKVDHSDYSVIEKMSLEERVKRLEK